jgi:hypothetical protein
LWAAAKAERFRGSIFARLKPGASTVASSSLDEAHDGDAGAPSSGYSSGVLADFLTVRATVEAWRFSATNPGRNRFAL